MRCPKSQSFSSFSSVLVWIGENDTKTLVWIKIFCFVFATMKTDTFENGIVSFVSTAGIVGIVSIVSIVIIASGVSC